VYPTKGEISRLLLLFLRKSRLLENRIVDLGKKKGNKKNKTISTTTTTTTTTCKMIYPSSWNDPSHSDSRPDSFPPSFSFPAMFL